MAKLSREEVEHIAKLSRLELSPEEKDLYSRQLSSVLEYVEQLREIDTENVAEAKNISGLTNVFRKDEVKNSGVGYDEIEKNAPEFRDGNFIVPGVFE